MKLELKHLAPYFPYNLKVVDNGYEWDVTKICLDVNQYANIENTFGDERLGVFDYIKPILRPISSMKWEEARELMSIVIEDDVIGCVDIEASALENKVEIISCTPYGEYKIIIDNYDSDIKAYYEYYGGQIDPYPVTYQAFQFLFKKHFDIFNLIKNGLAIEKQL